MIAAARPLHAVIETKAPEALLARRGGGSGEWRSSGEDAQEFDVRRKQELVDRPRRFKVITAGRENPAVANEAAQVARD